MAYVAANIIGAGIWLTLYLLNKKLRREMLIMSLVATPLAVFDLFFVPTYWNPITMYDIPVGIEGFIFSFQLGGIAAVSYAAINHVLPVRIHHYHKPISIVVLLIILPLFLLLKYFNLPNVMIAMYLALLGGTAIILLIRKDLTRSALLGAITFGSIYFLALAIWVSIFPEVKGWFTFQGLPRIFLLNAPLYELLFGILFAAYWGNLYELLFGYRFRKLHAN